MVLNGTYSPESHFTPKVLGKTVKMKFLESTVYLVVQVKVITH